jgi:hypothetical protein
MDDQTPRRGLEDAWTGGALLAPEEVEGCLADALEQARVCSVPLAVLCAYRPDLRLSPHPVAEVAAAAAIVIHNLTRPTDSTGVIAGDTVIVILPNTTADGAWVVTERILAALLTREGTRRWNVSPITHAEQFGSARHLLAAVSRLAGTYAA